AGAPAAGAADERYHQARDVVAITANRCRHYNGLVHRTCRAGVDYQAVAGPIEDGQPLLPCIGRYSVFMANRCSSRSTYTTREAADRLGKGCC
ncbi:MAG: hypothetical protein RBT81_12570, partial [Gammaproteobacteria bacterium]|nr:hypothetical protein [Gammaproteobacteria bacterium]